MRETPQVVEGAKERGHVASGRLRGAPLRGRRVLAIDPGLRTGCKIVVLDELGRLLAHDAAAYSYLPRSTAYLPPPQVLADALGEAGFVDARHHTLLGGSVLVLSATRA